jgi:hypothetical protein
MLLLLACSPPAPPALAVPVGVPAVVNAEPVPVDRFLGHTALGASTDLLCPWARGEAVPDASLARWMAEKRLAWRVVEVGPAGATMDGTRDLRAATEAAASAADALAARCGTPARRDLLVVAGPDVVYADVFPTLEEGGRAGLAAWLLVSDPTPDAPPVPLRPGALLVVDVRGAAVSAADAGCVALTATSDTAWGAVLTAMDDLRARQLPLHRVSLLAGGPGAPAAPPATPAARRDVPLHAVVSALPLPNPGRCDVCGCVEPR